MPTRTIKLAFPPSVNYRWKGGGNHTYVESKTARFEHTSAQKIMLLRAQNKLPKTSINGSIFLIIYLRPPDKKIRDIDNYIKSINDTLTKGGVWKDDSQVKAFIAQWLEPNSEHKHGESIITIIYGSDYEKVKAKIDDIIQNYGAKLN